MTENVTVFDYILQILFSLYISNVKTFRKLYFESIPGSDPMQTFEMQIWRSFTNEMGTGDLTNEVFAFKTREHLAHTFDKIKKSTAFLFELFVVTLNECSAKSRLRSKR